MQQINETDLRNDFIKLIYESNLCNDFMKQIYETLL